MRRHREEGFLNLQVIKVVCDRVTLLVPACQPGWEELENLRGNLRGNNSEKVSLGGYPTFNVTLVCDLIKNLVEHSQIKLSSTKPE